MKVSDLLRIFAALVVAFSATSASSEIDWTYTRPRADSSFAEWIRGFVDDPVYGKTYAVIVGIDEFKYFDRLDATSNDPERIFKFFRDKLAVDQILLLKNNEVTHEVLRQLFEFDLPNLMNENDRLIFYWSGHGTQFKNARGIEQGFLPLAHSRPQNKATMVSMRDLSNWDAEIPARHALYLLDACFSGLAGTALQSQSQPLPIEQLSRPGRHIISAGGRDEQTIASRQRWQGSIFAHALLKALNGDADRFGGSEGGGDGIITLYELVESITNTVDAAKADSGWNRPLRPVLNQLHGEGQFFFLNPDVIDRSEPNDGIATRSAQHTTSLSEASASGIERELMLSREEKRFIQSGLIGLGINVGLVDGIFGSQTRSAIRRFQRLRGYVVSGFLTADQAKLLIQAGIMRTFADEDFGRMSELFKVTPQAIRDPNSSAPSSGAAGSSTVDDMQFPGGTTETSEERVENGREVLDERDGQSSIRFERPPILESSIRNFGQETPSSIADLPPITGNQFSWPVTGEVISTFGLEESSFFSDSESNDGINIAAPRGTNILAAEDGFVVYAGNELAGFGNLILIRHANNWVTGYAHADQMFVVKDEFVRTGQAIGTVGSTGSVNEPQLHFEIRLGTEAVDPIPRLLDQ